MSEKEENEIDLMELAQKLWANKKFIIKCSIIGAIVGIIIAFSIPKEYSSKVSFKLDNQDEMLSGMGSLASLAGFEISGSNELISPDLYPEIINSTPFIQSLFDIIVEDSSQNIESKSFYNYIKEDQHYPWWKSIVSFFIKIILSENKGISETNHKYKKNIISKNDLEIIEYIQSLYSVESDSKTGVISIDVNTQSPSISMFLADSITYHLQTYITNFKTEKAKKDLENTIQLYEISKNNYYKAQQNLATFIDSNKGLKSAIYQLTEDRLKNEKDLYFSIYNQMAQQVQMSEIKLQDRTPSFIIIQPSIKAIYPSSPNKKLILALFLLISIIGSSSWILRKDLHTLFRN